eukprot:CAMPEP_0181308096 /NCGR_PEP_ID=MMETSP1101-20121128/11263_1 /TAXON_ID=46948 /ORGANISM="Rhodomonas abbreviata, Strain Caron Lab Isolate" /LENGTH=282 /DNA_ID=CAMNT_0023414421 /DNA_START=152 /DNA_END=1000 /DNA_ORIENTATION=+
MADEGLTKEQKLEIARAFILSAPPGEVNDVVQDVSTLVGADAGLQEKLPTILQEYNENNNVVLKGADGASVVISKAGMVEPNKYKDPVGGKLVTVDHTAGEITATEPLQPVDAAAEESRGLIQAAMNKYVAENVSAGSVCVHAASASSFHVALVTTKLNPRNLWNGRWRSTWEVTVGGAGSGEITGQVVAEVHYYEEGNVQLNAQKTAKTPLSFNDPPSFAAAVVKAVKEAEAELQTFLEDSYRSMSDTSFKALRRKMPLTQTKFQWHKLTAYSLAQELTHK